MYTSLLSIHLCKTGYSSQETSISTTLTLNISSSFCILPVLTFYIFLNVFSLKKQRKPGSQSCAYCPVLLRAAACPRLVAVAELSFSGINGKHSSRKIYSNTLHGVRNNKKPSCSKNDYHFFHCDF